MGQRLKACQGSGVSNIYVFLCKAGHEKKVNSVIIKTGRLVPAVVPIPYPFIE